MARKNFGKIRKNVVAKNIIYKKNFEDAAAQLRNCSFSRLVNQSLINYKIHHL
jgi:hypothetical protein